MVYSSQVILKAVGVHVTVTYKGHVAYAATFPWEGIDALDTAVMPNTNIRVGIKPNIVPDGAQLIFKHEGSNCEELEVLTEKVSSCFEAVALMTGCKVHGEWNLLHYSSVDQADLYQANVKSFGVTFDPQVQQQTWGSPDMGNVSKKIPSNHVLYDIGCKASNHCHAFMAAAMT
ncbi:hypothetical protein pdam_00015563, partial [Pocillopora damicornis]